jgi:hypothetical protein
MHGGLSRHGFTSESFWRGRAFSSVSLIIVLAKGAAALQDQRNALERRTLDSHMRFSSRRSLAGHGETFLCGLAGQLDSAERPVSRAYLRDPSAFRTRAAKPSLPHNWQMGEAPDRH